MLSRFFNKATRIKQQEQSNNNEAVMEFTEYIKFSKFTEMLLLITEFTWLCLFVS